MRKPRVLVTAGNTAVPIDRVRAITNIFKGRTGARIAEFFADQGCRVTLLTSHPELVERRAGLTVFRYSTYDQLMGLMAGLVAAKRFDAIIHSSAVSDYRVGGTYRLVGTSKPNKRGRITVTLEPVDRSGKIGSDHPELWLKLAPTEKIVDKIRADWGFKGKLVKFKLQVGMTDDELIHVARSSMKTSQADAIVANTLEGMNAKAFIVSANNARPRRVNRAGLPAALYQEVFP